MENEQEDENICTNFCENDKRMSQRYNIFRKFFVSSRKKCDVRNFWDTYSGIAVYVSNGYVSGKMYDKSIESNITNAQLSTSTGIV